ncbi:GNAT family N-acetyltransferase [Streptomyces sp. AP-93]|uniref:GNAT family N-acetyltransferase n=1 Tax=Streptomyces sp. AP-93 TaxID=2929048 RepID=UPI001FB048D5|nr:GNAT family N-acetyltransferase [Streptomyces sp. AP-93]MCJ0875559.1 GNAT family N-acetyltransferase [Streptomyces sp. AP-93]
MRTEIVDSLAGVADGAWNTLSAGSFYGSLAWMRYQEAAPDSSVRYVLVRDASGRLVAGMPIYVVDSEASGMYNPRVLFPDAAGTIGASRRTVLVGNRRGYSNRLLIDERQDRNEITKMLVDAVNLVASQEADGQAWWLYLGEGDTETLLTHANRAVPRLLAADCAIPLPGDSFGDYLQQGTSNMRRQIRKDREAFQRAEYTCTEVPFADVWAEMSPLITSHQAHHGEPADPAVIRRLMREQAEATGESGIVHACHLGGVMRGCTLTYTTEREVSSRAYGFDHSRPAVAGEYFELLYYRPMEAAYRSGARRLHLGIGTLRPKIRRGAEVSFLWAVSTGERLGTDGSGEAAANNAARWQPMADELGGAARQVMSGLLEHSL